MSVELTAGIVRILNRSGATVGTGFVVSDKGLIATCAHVVKHAGAGVGGSLRIAFHAATQEAIAIVESEGWNPPGAADTAFLRLKGPLPEEVEPLPLGSSRDSRGHPFRSRGYRLAEHFSEGLGAEGRIQDHTRHNEQEVLQLWTNQIDKGMSGAPLWDEKGRRVVGMVNAFWETQRHPDAWLAFAIPTESLLLARPDLQVSDICPYKGLAAFEETDAEFFFGREALARELVDRLRGGSRFLTLVGPSGSGKSSVVQAGLFPALRRGALPGSADWQLLSFRPGADPLAALNAAGLDVPQQGDLRPAIRAFLEHHPQAKRLVMVADQFEELFALCPEPVREQFLDSILALLVSDLPVTIILVLRADFYNHLFGRQPLVDWLEMGQVNVSPMGPGELKSAVTEPANQTGLRFEPALVETIIDEAGKTKHPLPLLESALTQLWEKREEGLLTRAAYDAVGGVPGAISQWAEDAYAELAPDDRRLAKRVFTRLVRYGEGEVTDTRQRRSFSELVTRLEEREPLHQLVRRLADRRLLVTGGTPGAETVEIVHDSLLQQWHLLRRWVTEQREFYLWRQRLDERIQEWEEQGKDRGALLHGALLSEAEQRQAGRKDLLNTTEQAYIQESMCLQEKRERRRRWRFIGTVVAAVVFFLLSGVALVQWRQAEERRVAQERMADEMQSLALASNARQALDDRNPDLAIALALAATQLEDPPLRAQSALMAAAYASHTQQILDGHDEWVFGVDFDPKGNTVLSGSYDNSVRLWNARTGQEIRRFDGHTAPVRSVAFSPDGSRALSASEDESLILWDLKTGKTIRQFQGHRDWVLSVAFGPDGHRALSGSADKTVILWDVDSGKIIHRLDGVHTDAVWGVAFSPLGNTAASASADGRMCLWDLNSAMSLGCSDEHDARVLTVAFSPDGHTLLTGSADYSLILWKAENREVIHRLEGHTNWVYDVTFSPNEQTALSASADGSLILWDLERGVMIHRLDGHADEVQSVAFGPSGHVAVSGARDNSIRLWDLDDGIESHTLIGQRAEVLAVALSPDGNRMLSGGGDSNPSLVLWDVQDRRMIWEFQEHDAAISSIAFSHDGRMALTGSHDHTLILWDIATGSAIHRFTSHDGAVRSVAFSPDDRWALSGGSTSDYCLLLWNLDSKQEADRLCGHTNIVTSIAFGPDGKTALSGSHDHILIRWDVETGEELDRFYGHNGWVLNVSLAQDGRTALSASSDGTLILWDVKEGERIRRFDGHVDRVWSIAPSPDGRTAVSGSADGSLILWELESGMQLRRFYRHDDWVWSVAFSPDASTVVSGSADETIRLWSPLPSSVSELAEWFYASRFVRPLTCGEREMYRVEPLCGEK